MLSDCSISFSVIIPLYNKETEIGRALNSACSQSYPPHEIIVIDDGSTDNGASIAESHLSPLIKVIRQPNKGVSAARNRGITEASGRYIALLDGDDWWNEHYLETIADLITEFPDCGAYCTAFNIVSNDNTVRAASPRKRGVVDNFFRRAMTNYICQPSSTVIPKTVFDKLGGFPTGMKLGEDQYMWIKIARNFAVCFSPEEMVYYCRTASNRSSKIYKSEQTDYSFEDFYNVNGDMWLNEFLARCAIGKALTLSAKGDTDFGKRTEKFFRYTEHYKRGWYKLWILNRMPRCMRSAIHNLYNRAAWTFAHKGL